MEKQDNDSRIRRLQRARQQYEALLVQAGDILSPSKAVSRESDYIDEDDISIPTIIAEDVRISRSKVNNYRASEIAKEGVVSLQVENERLKDKLNHVIKSAEDIISELQSSQNSIQKSFQAREAELLKTIEQITCENSLLKDKIDILNREHTSEHHKLIKSLRYLQRVTGRHPSSFLSKLGPSEKHLSMDSSMTSHHDSKFLSASSIRK